MIGGVLAWTNVADEAIWDAVVHCTKTFRVFPDSDREPVLFPSLRAADFYRRHHARFLLATTVSPGDNVFNLRLFTGKAGTPTGRAPAVDVVAMRDERPLRIFAIHTARTREEPGRFVLPPNSASGAEWRRVSMQFALRGEEKDADLRVEETVTTRPFSALDQPLLLPPRSITLLDIPWSVYGMWAGERGSIMGHEHNGLLLTVFGRGCNMSAYA